MNIDFIKWLVDYAEGFSLKRINEEDGVDYIGFTVPFYLVLNAWVFDPLLLQRAVIGINKDEESNYDITMYPDSLEIGAYHDGSKDKTYEDVDDYEKGIEQALKYIWEQEK